MGNRINLNLLIYDSLDTIDKLYWPTGPTKLRISEMGTVKCWVDMAGKVQNTVETVGVFHRP